MSRVRPRSRDPAPKRDVRWGKPILSPDGRIAVTSVRAADNTERWLAAIDPATGKTTVLDHIKDEAWVRDGGTGLAAGQQARVVPRRARRLDASLHGRRDGGVAGDASS